jgi:outer membrane protein assembly factor BamB
MSAATIIDETIYVGSLDGRLLAFNKANGALQWTYPINGSLQFSPAIENGTLYITTASGPLYALNLHHPTPTSTNKNSPTPQNSIPEIPKTTPYIIILTITTGLSLIATLKKKPTTQK